MRYPASETAARHRKILEVGLSLFQERGYGNVTVDQVLEATGLTRGGFYSRYASKLELFEEVLVVGSRKALELARSMPTGPIGREAFVSEYLSPRRLEAPAQASVEWTLLNDIARLPSTRASFTIHFEAMVDEIRRRFVRGGAANPTAEAIFLLSALVGAAQLARATDDEGLRVRIIQALQRSAV